MNVIQYLSKGKLVQSIPVCIVVILCFLRINTATINIDYMAFYFDKIAFAILPLVLWVYLQRLHRFFSCAYVQSRLTCAKERLFALHMVTNIAVTIFFTLSCYVVFVVLTASEWSMNQILNYILLGLCLILIYILFLSIYHCLYLLIRNMKYAFVLSLVFMICYQRTRLFIDLSMINSQNFLNSDVLGKLSIILCSVLISNLFCILYSRKIDILYEKIN